MFVFCQCNLPLAYCTKRLGVRHVTLTNGIYERGLRKHVLSCCLPSVGASWATSDWVQMLNMSMLNIGIVWLSEKSKCTILRDVSDFLFVGLGANCASFWEGRGVGHAQCAYLADTCIDDTRPNYSINIFLSCNTYSQQECIPVRCVPSACWLYPVVSHVFGG